MSMSQRASTAARWKPRSTAPSQRAPELQCAVQAPADALGKGLITVGPFDLLVDAISVSMHILSSCGSRRKMNNGATQLRMNGRIVLLTNFQRDQTLAPVGKASTSLHRTALERRRLQRVLMLLLIWIVAALPQGTLASAQRLDHSRNAGVIHGQALNAEEGVPIPYALVILLPDGLSTAARSVLTDRDGRYRFEQLPPGGYRVRLDRIGFGSDLSPVFHVRAAEEVLYVFQTSPRPVELPEITVQLACYTADRLWQDSSLAALWQEAEKALATRRAFDRQYRYTYDIRQEVTAHVRSKGRLVERKDSQTIAFVNHAQTAEDDRERRRARRQTGFGRQTRRRLALVVPDGSELLAPEFLRNHCLEREGTTDESVHTLRFRPLIPARNRIEIRGVVRLDVRTYQIRSVDIEYMRGHTPFMQARIEYADIGVPGGLLRLPWRGALSGRPTGAMGRSMVKVVGAMTFQNHRNLEQVSPVAAADP